MASPRRLKGKKLLVASIGVAAVSYIGCSSTDTATSGNFVAPPPCQDAGCGGAGGASPDGGTPDANSGG